MVLSYRNGQPFRIMRGYSVQDVGQEQLIELREITNSLGGRPGIEFYQTRLEAYGAGKRSFHLRWSAMRRKRP